MLTFDEIKEIIDQVNRSCIQHFELNHEATKIIIDKQCLSSTTGTMIDPQATPELDSLSTLQGVEEKEQVTKKALSAQKEENFHQIVSPTVGTFYSAPEPGAEPFVKVGQQVNASQVVCVLEAMKLFNEVEAGVTGKVIEILVKDGDFIEYGHPLFLVKPE